jgi:hypothetical protein
MIFRSYELHRSNISPQNLESKSKKQKKDALQINLINSHNSPRSEIKPKSVAKREKWAYAY